MPAKSSLVPKYCLHKPSGQAYVRICGKVCYVGHYGTDESKAEYGRLVAELATNPAVTSAMVATSALTVVEVADAYWDFSQGYYRKNGRPTSQIAIIRLAIRHIKSLYGHTPAGDFGPLALQVVKSQLIEKNLARKTINHLLGTIKRLFKWATSQQLVSVTVYQALLTVSGVPIGRTNARETMPVLPVDVELVDATLPCMPLIVADMVRFQRLTGARPSEVCQLRPCDVDRSGEVWTYTPRSHKTEHHGRQRTIYIGPKAQQVLQPYLLRDAESNCFQPVESEQKRHEEQRKQRITRVQPSQWNRRKAKPKRVPRTAYNKDSYQRAIARAIMKANKEREEAAVDMGVKPILLPHWHANQLRHSRATEVRREFNLEAAQVSLGHAKADTTQIYAERDARLAVEVARKIG